MKKNTLIITLTLFLFTILITLFCGEEPYNPLDTTDPRYKWMTVDIISDNDTTDQGAIILTTDSSLVIGIESDFLDRIDSVRIKFDADKVGGESVMLKRSDLTIAAGTRILYLNNPHKYSEVGTYNVEVMVFSINGDNATSTVMVVVGGVPPRFSRHPESQSIAETDSAVFSAVAVGTAPLHYYWFYTTDTTQEGTRCNPYDSLNDFSYTDNFVEMADSGYIYCKVKNGFAEVVSRFARLKVTPQILDADAPTVYFDKDSSNGGEDANAVVTLKLSTPYNKEVLVRITALSSSRAKEGEDYRFITNNVVIPAQSTSANLEIDIINDVTGEETEILGLQIVNSARNARVGDSSKHYYTIFDDDVADSTWPELYFTSNSGSGIEGQNALVEMGLGLKTQNWQYVVSVNCRISKSSSAKAIDDFTLIDSVVTFNINETTRRITLQINKDKISETDETVKLELVNPGKAVLSKTRPTVYTYTIKDGNLCSVYFKKMEMAKSEGDSTNTDSIEVRLSSPNVNEITAKYEIVPDPVLYTAINRGTDYLLPAEAFVKFPPMVDSAFIKVVVIDDTLREGTELFALKLTDPTGGAVVQESEPFKYIIRDNETTTLSFTSDRTSVQENVGDISIPVALSKLSSDTIMVDYRLAGNALGTDADYIIKNDNNHKLIFPPMSREQNIEITIVDDVYDEPDKSFSIQLENPTGGAEIDRLAGHTVIIVDNDIPTFTFTSSGLVAGEGDGRIDVPVKLSNPSLVQLKIRFAVSGSSTALAGKDYLPFTSDTIVFGAGDSLYNIALVLADDNVEENDKTVAFNLFALDSTTSPGSNTATTVTIKDNDVPTSIAFANDTVTVDEGDNTLRLPLVVAGQTDKAINVGYQVTYRSANCDSTDFILGGTGRIALNASADRFIPVVFKNDRVFNENDTLIISLLDPQNATLGTLKDCRIAIRDDDFKVTVQRADTNGIVTPSGEQSVTRSIPLQITATPQPHFHFTGWSISNGINIEDASKPSTNVNITSVGGTVTANFAIDSFNIVISADNGTVTPTGSVKAAWGDVLSPVPVPTIGFNFKSWSVTADSIEPLGDIANITTKFRVKGTGTIKAMHSNKAYSVNVVSSNSLFGSVTPTVTQEKNWEETFEIKATAVTNAKFVQWKADSDSLLKSIGDTLAATATVTTRKTGTITALFAPDSFTLTLLSGNTTMGGVDPATKKMTYFDSCTITASPVTGYAFTGWTITAGMDKITINDVANAQTRTKKLSTNATVTANFAPIKYQISLQQPTEGGTISSLPVAGMHDFGTAVTLTAVPVNGWKLKNWTGGNAAPSGTLNRGTAILTANTTYSAVYEREVYDLTLSSIPEASVTPGTISGCVFGIKKQWPAAPNDVKVTIVNTAQYVFNNKWTVTSGNANIETDGVTLSSAATIKPFLDTRKWTFSLQTGITGGSISSVPAAGSVDYGTVITLTALPTAGWVLANWSGGNAAPSGTPNQATATVTGLTTYSVSFDRIIYDLTLIGVPNEASVNIGKISGCQHGIEKPWPTAPNDVKVTINNPARFSHVGWNVPVGTATVSATGITLTTAATIQPNLVPNKYSFSLGTTPASGWGTVTADHAASSTWDYGTTIIFTATPATGYKVQSWSGGNISATDATHATATLIGTTSYNVTFVADNVTLTVNPSTNGKSTPAPGTYTYAFGTVVNLAATSDTGYQFGSWTGTTGGASTTVTMDASKTVSVTFAEIPGKSGVMYVWSGLTTGNHNGSNWANALSDLNTAVQSAAADAVIWVRCGIYTPTATLTPAAGVKIYGGFNGFENQYQDVNNRYFYNHFTIIKGTNTPTIMKLSSGRDTISGCVFDGATTNAIYIESSSNCIEDCVIKNTGSSSTSKAIDFLPLYGSTIASNTIQRSVFHSNTGTNTNAGKAITIGPDVFGTRILNSVFYKNGGPAINNSNTSPDDASKTSIIGCTIIDNGTTAWNAPGGIKNSSGNTYLQGSILWANKSNGTKATQIDVADWVEDCDIQDHTTTGITTKKRWQSDNLMVDPVLNSVQILADGAWFAPSASHVFLPGAAALHNANFTPRPAHDVRKILRVGNYYNMGAYEE